MDVKRVTGILVGIIVVLALGSTQLYSKALEAVEVECEESEWTEDYQDGQFGREGGTENWTDTGDTIDEEFAWIRSEIDRLKKKPELQIGATAIHRAEKTVVLWVYERTPENQQLHGTMIDGWKIIVAESPEPEPPKTLLLVSVGRVELIATSSRKLL